MSDHFATRFKMLRGSLAALLGDRPAPARAMLRQLADVTSQVVRLRDDAATPEDAREVDALIEEIEKAVADQTQRVRPRKRDITADDRQRLERFRELLPSLADGHRSAIELDSDPIPGGLERANSRSGLDRIRQALQRDEPRSRDQLRRDAADAGRLCLDPRDHLAIPAARILELLLARLDGRCPPPSADLAARGAKDRPLTPEELGQINRDPRIARRVAREETQRRERRARRLEQ